MDSDVIYVRQLVGGDRFLWPKENGKTETIKVSTIDRSPDGCKGKCHINSTLCFDAESPVKLVLS